MIPAGLDLYNRKDDTGADPRGPRWEIKTNSRGIVVSRIRYFALEGRDAAWEARERRRLPGIAFDLQHGETYEVPVGSPYWPIFAERVHEIPPTSDRRLDRWRFEGWYIRDAPAIWSNLRVYLGLDGGRHRPAMLLCQYDPANGLFWAMRELRVADFQAGEFIALVRFMLGMVTIEGLRAEQKRGLWNTDKTIAWIEQERRDPFYGWEMPWVPMGTPLKVYGFMAAHEAKATNQMARDSELNTLRKLYHQQGIRLLPAAKEWDHRDIVIDFLLHESGLPGVPRLLVDSSCKWLIKGLAGGLVLPPQGQPTGGPLRDRMFEDVYDALCNAACAVFPLQYADRLRALDAQQARQREAALRRDAAGRQHGRRWQERVDLNDEDWRQSGGQP